MSEIVTQKIQSDIKLATDAWQLMRIEALDLYNLYWKTDVNATVGALALGTTPCSQQSKLTKADAQAAAGLVEDIGTKFFDNVAIATSDRQVTCQKLANGKAVPTLIDDQVEEFCNRAAQLGQDCITQDQRSNLAEDFYNSSEMGGALSGMSAQTIVFGSEMTKDDLTSAITLAQQWQNFINNAAVTTGDYKATLGKWERL